MQTVLATPGRPLDAATQQFMAPRLATDFDSVRIHTDEPAAASADAVQARAYTVGEHIVFNDGEYAPTTTAGRALLAHELAHVVQQRGAGASLQRKESDDFVPAPVVVPILTSPEIALPCPSAVHEIVPEFIRESREHAAAELKAAGYDSPSRAQLAKEAWLFLGVWRQTYPAEDPRDPTDAELAIACAEHHNYARFLVASGTHYAATVRAMIDGYTFLKDQLSHAGIEWLLSADGNTPTKPTRCQNDWGHRGVNEGLRDLEIDQGGG